jgi:MFS transporter, CP family, cyanate transporter
MSNRAGWPEAGTVLAVAIGVRPQIVLLGPLVPWLVVELDASHATLGLVGTATLLATAGGSVVAREAVGRLGLARTITLALVLLLIGAVGRAAAPGVELLLVASLAAGLGIGMTSSALIGWAHAARLSPRAGSTSYTLGMMTGSIAAGLLAAPLATLAWGWRGAIFAIGILSLLALVAWHRRPRAGQREETWAPLPAGRPLRPVAWGLAVAFGLQAGIYLGLIQWAPDLLVERGWSPAVAGAVVGMMNLIGLVANLALFGAGSRAGTPGRQVIAAAVVIATGTALIVVLPNPLPGLVVAAIGFGTIFPALFAGAMVASTDATEAARTSALMNSLGFGIAALTPVLLGVTRTLTGAYALPMIQLIGIAGVLLAIVVAVDRALRAPATA